MSIEASLERMAVALERLVELAGATSTEAPAEEPKPAPVKKKKAAKKEPEAPEKNVTEADVRTAITKVIREKSQEDAKNLLAAVGAEKMSEVPAEKYGELHEAAMSLLAA